MDLEYQSHKVSHVPTTFVSAKRAIELLKEVVEEAGRDHIQIKCRYEHNGPCCIIGRVLSKLGLSLDQLRQLDIDGSLDKNQTRFSAKANYVLPSLYVSGITFTPWAIMILTVAQNVQDHRHFVNEQVDDDRSWGHALDVATDLYTKLQALGYPERSLGALLIGRLLNALH